MKEIQLTRGKVALVDDEDYSALSAFNWQYKERKRKDGSICGYAKRPTPKVKGQKQGCIYMHRQIMQVTDRHLDVDHENKDGLDNRRQNLRICTRSDNNKNRASKSLVSKYKGLQRVQSGKWCAKIKVNGVFKYLGRFDSEIEAARAFDEAAIATGSTFYHLNFPFHK